ncbi:unnamed protein product [Cutaneotrichosporon oleaginosum]
MPHRSNSSAADPRTVHAECSSSESETGTTRGLRDSATSQNAISRTVTGYEANLRSARSAAQERAKAETNAEATYERTLKTIRAMDEAFAHIRHPKGGASS